MSGKNKTNRKTVLREEMTDTQKEIDEMLVAEAVLSKQIRNVEKRINSETAIYRQEMRDKITGFKTELKGLYKIRKARRKLIFAYWDKHHPEKRTIVFPSVMVSKRNFRKLVVHDRIALLDALDRIGRLDLVEYVFKENVIARFIAEGKLATLDNKAVEVIDNIDLQIRSGRGSDCGL